MRAREPQAMRMIPDRGWQLAAIEALLSASAVAATAWYSVVHAGELSAWLEALAPTWRGLMSVTTMLFAGGLLARALGRAEEAASGWRLSRRAKSEADR